jgi:NAD+ synthase (glutamine-hydrolysing)
MAILNVGLAQLQPKLGDVAANLRTHLQLMEEAAERGVELLVFPELSLTGYHLRDLIQEVATPPDSPTFAALYEASRRFEMDIMVGFVDVTVRSNFYIAAAYISRGELLHVHHKVYLPTYTMFDDGRFFAWGEEVRAFDTRFGRIGMLICEDFWHVSTSYLLWLDGADMLVMQSASPGRGLDSHNTLQTQRSVNRLLQTYGFLYTTYVIHCNRVGFEDGQIFWGGSSIVEPGGEIVVEAPSFDEALVIKKIDLGQVRRSRSQTTLLRDERTPLLMQELNRILMENPLGLR